MRNNKKKWFIAVRGSYLPSSRQGWLTYIPFIVLVATGILCFVLPIIASMQCTGEQVCTSLTLGEAARSLLYVMTYEFVIVGFMHHFAKSKS